MVRDMKTRRPTFARGIFSPVEDDSVERLNCRTLMIVGRDGTVRERVSLQTASAAHREQLICLHYLRQLGHCFFEEEQTGVTIHGRDTPWDFDLELSNGDRFFLEITAIADSRFQFERDKREERLRLASGSRRIRLRDLRKLASMFPSELVDRLLTRHAATPADLEVENPFFTEGPNLTAGHVLPPERRLEEEIVAAVSGKAAKRHAGKERTVLILDYRGNFADAAAFSHARQELVPYFEACPFAEVWFYVGYFSGDDGNNAEFTFAPLKLPGNRMAKIRTFASQRGLDEFKRVVW